MIDWTRPVQTRDGRQVKIYAMDVKGRFPVHGCVEGVENPLGWTKDGSYMESGCPNNFDIVNAPRRVRVERWINVYQDGCTGGLCESRDSADASASTAAICGRVRFACKQFTFEVEEGEGLS